MSTPADTRVASAEWARGLRSGAGLAVAAFALAVSFGATAVGHAWPPWAAVVMSAVVFAGGAQFALVLALADGGGVLAALGAATLINLRFVPMAMTVAASLRGGRWWRSVQAQAVVDGSWAVARRTDGTFSRETLLGATLVQWPAWVAGTALGAYLTPEPGLSYALGLDVVFPAFFLVVVLDSLRAQPRLRAVALAGAVLATVMCWVVEPGIALVCAGAAAGLAVRPSRREAPR